MAVRKNRDDGSRAEKKVKRTTPRNAERESIKAPSGSETIQRAVARSRRFLGLKAKDIQCFTDLEAVTWLVGSAASPRIDDQYVVDTIQASIDDRRSRNLPRISQGIFHPVGAFEAAVVRAIEHCQVGGFNRFLRDLTREDQAWVRSGENYACSKEDDNCYLLLLCRSTLAMSVLNKSLKAFLRAISSRVMTAQDRLTRAPWSEWHRHKGREVISLTSAAVLAFASARLRPQNPSKIAQRAIEVLLEYRKRGGGWPAFADDPNPDLYTTIAAIYALWSHQPRGWKHAISSSVNWLVGQQLSNGSWPQVVVRRDTFPYYLTDNQFPNHQTDNEPGVWTALDATTMTVMALDAIAMTDGDGGNTISLLSRRDRDSVPSAASVVPKSGQLPEFIEQLLAGGDNVELTPSQLALLEVHLNQQTLSVPDESDNRSTSPSLSETARNKLTVILDYNRKLIEGVGSKPPEPPDATAGTSGASTGNKSKRRGRPKATNETIRAEQEIADAWQRAKESKTSKVTFARDRKIKMSVKDLDRLLDRVSQRNRRSDN